MTNLFVSSVSYQIYSFENNQYIVKVAYCKLLWSHIRIAKTKALISYAFAKSQFSHNEALLFAIKSFSVIFFIIFFSFFVAI